MRFACAKGILIVMFGLATKPISAQQKQAPTLETMLSDAGYAFNRYDELASGIDCDSWRVPDSLKRSCKDELKSVGENVSVAKAILARLRDTKEDDLVALFRVYRALDEVSGHLDELSRNLSDFTEKDGVPYAQAGAKALKLAADLGNEIESRLIIQQSKLEHCSPTN